MLCDCFANCGEVINADSVQVYKGLDIGSAKATLSERAIIAHHLIDILEPWENYNVADFITLADTACSGIWKKGLIPVVSGGTAFYFKHFLYGLSSAPKSDASIRQEVSSYIESAGLQEAHKMLCSIDAVSGLRINPNDKYRISRALEVYRATGKPLSSFELPTTPRNDMKVISIGLFRDKDELRERIKKRVSIMFETGIVEEIKNLLSLGANPNWQSMQGIGYREFFNKIWQNEAKSSIEALENLSSSALSEIAQEIEMNSIHYAKRQMTFFKSFSNVTWVDPQKEAVLEAIQNHIDAQ